MCIRANTHAVEETSVSRINERTNEESLPVRRSPLQSETEKENVAAQTEGSVNGAETHLISKLLYQKKNRTRARNAAKKKSGGDEDPEKMATNQIQSLWLMQTMHCAIFG